MSEFVERFAHLLAEMSEFGTRFAQLLAENVASLEQDLRNYLRTLSQVWRNYLRKMSEFGTSLAQLLVENVGIWHKIGAHWQKLKRILINYI